jgi:hypothetical protein
MYPVEVVVTVAVYSAVDDLRQDVASQQGPFIIINILLSLHTWFAAAALITAFTFGTYCKHHPVVGQHKHSKPQ